MLERIKKNKGVLILIFVVIVILVIYQISATKKSALPTSSPSPTPDIQKYMPPRSSYKLPVYSQPATDSLGLIDLTSVKVREAVAQKSKIESQLPIYIEGFKTKAGPVTTLNVYSIPEDPPYLIHTEIYGINYSDPNLLEENNQNAQAFIESFNEIKDLLNAKGVDIHKVYFVLGSRPYILGATDSLIRKYSLF